MKVIDLKTDYEVAEGPVTLTVVIGEAQIGASVVKMDGAVCCEGTISDCSIGDGPAIRGKTLFVKSVVSDVNDNTNRTSVVYELCGGRQDQTYLSSGTVDEDGDSMIYRAWFRLV